MWRDNCGLGKLAHSFWEKVELKLPLKGKMGFRKSESHVMTDMSKGKGGAGYETGLTGKKFPSRSDSNLKPTDIPQRANKVGNRDPKLILVL